MAAHENDRHFCRLSVNGKRMSLGSAHRKYNRKGWEIQNYVRLKIRGSFPRGRSPAIKTLISSTYHSRSTTILQQQVFPLSGLLMVIA